MIFITIEIDVNVDQEAQNLHQLHDIVHVEESEGCLEFFNLLISLDSIVYAPLFNCTKKQKHTPAFYFIILQNFSDYSSHVYYVTCKDKNSESRDIKT